MSTKFLFFSLIVLITACGVVPKEEENPNLKTVNIHGTVHVPYCGGAKPSPDVAAGYYESMKFEKFNLIKGREFKEGMDVFQEVSMDEGGNVTLHLEKGEYMLIKSNKYLPLDQYIKENGPLEEENFKILGDDCFKKWKNTVDMYFTVSGDTIIELRQKSKCWIGTNPCIEYVGPPAP